MNRFRSMIVDGTMKLIDKSLSIGNNIHPPNESIRGIMSQSTAPANPCVENRFVPVVVPSVNQSVHIEPIDGKHYDAGLCMTSQPHVARWIFNMLIEHARNTAQSKKENLEEVVMVEASSGSGGFSRYFLENGIVKKLLVHTSDQAHIKMGRNILKDYGFDSKRYVMSKNFTGVTGTNKNAKKQNILFIDMFDNDGPTVQGQNKGYINGLSVEQWINKSWNCSVIGVRLPRGEQIDDAQLPNFIRKEYADLNEGDGYFLIYVPDPANPPPRISTKSAMASVSAKSVAASPATKKVKGLGLDLSLLDQRTAEVSTEPLKTLIKSETPAAEEKYYVKIYGDATDQSMVTCGLSKNPITYDEWLMALKGKLREILLLFLPRSDHIDRMLADDVIHIWVASFTHESIDDRSFKNYESMETLGDSTMKVNFQKYILELHPKVTPEQMTDMTSTYVAKTTQGDLGKKLGMTPYLRIDPFLSTNISVAEDMLEAFFGALIFSAEKAFGNMTIGHGLSYNFIKVLYGPMNITLKESLKSNVNYVKEVFDKVRLRYFLTRDERNPNKVVSRIYVVKGDNKMEDSYIEKNLRRLTLEATSAFNSLGVGSVPPGKPIILAEMSGPAPAMIKNSINNTIFGKGKSKLIQLGLTFEVASRIKFEKMVRDFDDNREYDLHDLLFEKLNDNGFVNGHFKDVKTRKDGDKVIRFSGVRPDGSLEGLVTASGSDKKSARRRTVCSYLGIRC